MTTEEEEEGGKGGTRNRESLMKADRKWGLVGGFLMISRLLLCKQTIWWPRTPAATLGLFASWWLTEATGGPQRAEDDPELECGEIKI